MRPDVGGGSVVCCSVLAPPYRMQMQMQVRSRAARRMTNQKRGNEYSQSVRSEDVGGG